MIKHSKQFLLNVSVSKGLDSIYQGLPFCVSIVKGNNVVYNVYNTIKWMRSDIDVR